MSDEKFTKLDDFLAKHQPVPPPAPQDELLRLKNRLKRPTPPFWLRSPLVVSYAVAATLLVVWMVGVRPFSSPDRGEIDSFVVSTLGDFYSGDVGDDGDELNELLALTEE